MEYTFSDCPKMSTEMSANGTVSGSEAKMLMG
jgi:hypothetical protein